MGVTLNSPKGGLTRSWHSVYSSVGFKKGYNFILFFIFNGALFGFTLSRLQDFDYEGIFCGSDGRGAAPGECFYYLSGKYRIGMMLHLFCIIPAGLLACFQFVPVIRHKAILFHRINGYLVLLLTLVGLAGALIIARITMGGGLDIQVIAGVLAICIVASLALAYYNVKKLQIDQHRAWMLRAWFYLASIITLRLILYPMSAIITNLGGYYTAMSCAKIDFIYGNSQNTTLAMYPGCDRYFSGANRDQHVMVQATMSNGLPEQIGATQAEGFGAAAWLAFILHLVGVEIYLRLTPRESERLRQVSYERQVEAGYKRPGRAGLTVDRFGDADEWQPAERKYEQIPLTNEQTKYGPTDTLQA